MNLTNCRSSIEHFAGPLPNTPPMEDAAARHLPEDSSTMPTREVDVVRIGLHPWQRRRLLILTCVFGLFIFPGSATVVLGVVGLILLPVTLNLLFSRTVLTPAGIRTARLFVRHAAPWSEVAVIAEKTIRPRSSRATTETWIHVQRTSGKWFTLAVPFDSGNGHDPEFRAKLKQIQDYWAAHRGWASLRDRPPVGRPEE